MAQTETGGEGGNSVIRPSVNAQSKDPTITCLGAFNVDYVRRQVLAPEHRFSSVRHRT